MKRPSNILLVEPTARSGFPPLGLMKIATYHNLLGDKLFFIIGKSKWHSSEYWDKIYITSLFTYDFRELIDTIRYYSSNMFNFRNIHVGGISATLLSNDIYELTGIKPHLGTMSDVDPFLSSYAKSNDSLKYLLKCGASIDHLPPDYTILGQYDNFGKFVKQAYIMYATKGCPNRCSFCAVNKLEPTYEHFIPILPRINYISKMTGDKLGLVLLDNNVAASNKFDLIIDEIKDAGFSVNSKLGGRKRFVDFNQGIDARLLDVNKIKKLTQIAIKPLRLALDNNSLIPKYREKVILSIESGIKSLSTYILYNFNDHPKDLYRRMRVNIDINYAYGSTIFSFPMKYVPLMSKDRKFIGKYWTKREIRAIQLILNVHKGIVSHRIDMFEHAFGRNEDEYDRILLMPQNYIFNRVRYEENGSIEAYYKALMKLSNDQILQLRELIKDGRLKKLPNLKNVKLKRVLEHYREEILNGEALKG